MDACKAHADNARDICNEEAKGKQKVANAEQDFGYSGTPADRNQVMVVKAQSAYAVAREKCDDKAGNVKDVCVKDAEATQTKALTYAKMGHQFVEAQNDASQARRDADHGVALEKCNAMAGDAKASCETAANLKHLKN
jgi:hypothetical protein